MVVTAAARSRQSAASVLVIAGGKRHEPASDLPDPTIALSMRLPAIQSTWVCLLSRSGDNSIGNEITV